jgi:hypothetical protein
MSQDMLDELAGHLAGAEGELWHAALARFLRRENAWSEVEDVVLAPPPAPRPPMWRRVSEAVIEVNLDAPPNLPFDGAVVNRILPGKIGWVRIERKGDELFQDDLPIELYRDPAQLQEPEISGDELIEKFMGIKEHLHPNVMDALMGNVSMIPRNWTGGWINFMRVLFRGHGEPDWRRYFYWNGECWSAHYITARNPLSYESLTAVTEPAKGR